MQNIRISGHAFVNVQINCVGLISSTLYIHIIDVEVRINRRNSIHEQAVIIRVPSLDSLTLMSETYAYVYTTLYRTFSSTPH